MGARLKFAGRVLICASICTGFRDCSSRVLRIVPRTPVVSKRGKAGAVPAIVGPVFQATPGQLSRIYGKRMRTYYLILVIALVPFAGCRGIQSEGLLSRTKSQAPVTTAKSGLLSLRSGTTPGVRPDRLQSPRSIAQRAVGSSSMIPRSTLLSRISGVDSQRSKRQQPMQFASDGPLANPVETPRNRSIDDRSDRKSSLLAQSTPKRRPTTRERNNKNEVDNELDQESDSDVRNVSYAAQENESSRIENADGQSLIEPALDPDQFDLERDYDYEPAAQQTEPRRTQPRETSRSRETDFAFQDSYDMELSNASYGEPDISIGRFPIDLPTVMQLAGADNWSVKIARERVCEAQAGYVEACAAWLPSLVYGAGYNHHEGEIQGTNGDIISASRGSWFFGGGAAVGNNPVAGGSGGPLRFTADLSLADAIYRPLVARRRVDAARLGSNRVFNDTMLAASVTYFDLVEAQAGLVIAHRNLQDGQRLAQITDAFVEAGKGTIADSRRVEVIINQRQQEIIDRATDVEIASARLAQVLQLDNTKLDPTMGLFAAENIVGPVDLVDSSLDVSSLVHTALVSREDICEAEQVARAAQTEAELERVRPFMPNVHLGYSGGVFGGGQGGNVDKLDGRSDVDVQVTWQLRNMGMGNRAALQQRQSQLRQAVYQGKQLKDSIATEVSTAYHRVQQFSRAMQLTGASVSAATDALEKNIESIRGLEGMPLESVSSVEQLATSRTEYLRSVMNYNRSQLQLIRAIGQPLNANGCNGSCGDCCDGSCMGY